jgi:hypothetical protein
VAGGPLHGGDGRAGVDDGIIDNGRIVDDDRLVDDSGIIDNDGGGPVRFHEPPVLDENVGPGGDGIHVRLDPPAAFEAR